MSALSSGTGAGWASMCHPRLSAECRTGSWEKKMRTWSPVRPLACPCRSKAYMSTGTRCTTTARPPPHRNNLKPWDGFLWSLSLSHSLILMAEIKHAWPKTQRTDGSGLRRTRRCSKERMPHSKASHHISTLVHHDQCRYQTFQKCECQKLFFFFFLRKSIVVFSSWNQSFVLFILKYWETRFEVSTTSVCLFVQHSRLKSSSNCIYTAERLFCVHFLGYEWWLGRIMFVWRTLASYP